MKNDQDLGKLILRLVVAGLMLFHGVHKLINGHGHIVQQLESHGLPKLLWIGVPISEVLAPIALIVGVATRISGLLIAFTMIMSLYLFFGLGGFEINDRGGLVTELNIFFLFASLSIFFLGSGKYSIYKSRKWIYQ